MSDSVPSIPADLRVALGELAETHTLLVALDFDGVLAPLVDHAADSRPLPGSAAAVKLLANMPRTTTAYISGRALGSLREVASPEAETLLIGSHGAETWTGPDAAPLTLEPEQTRALEEATIVIESVASAHEGTSAEYKPAGVVLHTRLASPEAAEAATGDARARLGHISGLHLGDGKSVLEVSVIKADKGQGLGRLRNLTGATAALFAGDDVTDEFAFRALGQKDVGIKVGPGDTAARFRVESPHAFTLVLEELVRLRADATGR
ncbi:trehalose-phosphatase [Arthrobacter roseus]|uniref:trehalose-phosphatase n=1 Tax=Arthrobacter roseus TaxID=136274 RepID=UPI001964F4C8|nr:trehalose-phosphatase [Arthrobacter roseus]MBM7847716.1 trehalose 6-phosphate phosphatase [Arthrobacter roseus]